MNISTRRGFGARLLVYSFIHPSLVVCVADHTPIAAPRPLSVCLVI
jgi:hypothetical protein